MRGQRRPSGKDRCNHRGGGSARSPSFSCGSAVKPRYNWRYGRRDSDPGRDRGRATPAPPPSYCPWCTTNSGSSRLPDLADEKPGQTLQATALVHEAYLRLVGGDPRPGRGTAAGTSSPPPPRPCAASWSRPPAASRPLKRGGDRAPGLELARDRPSPRAGPTNSSPLRRGPDRAASGQDPARLPLVKLRYFAGMTLQEAADAARHLVGPPLTGTGPIARAWLYRRDSAGGSPPAE